MQGCDQFGKIIKASHFKLMQEECNARGFDRDLVLKMTISELKKTVKDHEKKRNKPETYDSEKYFKPQGQKDLLELYSYLSDF